MKKVILDYLINQVKKKKKKKFLILEEERKISKNWQWQKVTE